MDTNRISKEALQHKPKRTKTHRTTEEEMEKSISFRGHKEKESNLILPEHDDDDDDDDSDTFGVSDCRTSGVWGTRIF
jgi:hypothetical protein